MPARAASPPQGQSGWPSPVTLAGRLRRSRLAAGLSIRQLADKAGVDKGTLVKLEKGHTSTYRTLVRVCDALGVSVVHLLQPEAAEAAPASVVLHRRVDERRQPRGAKRPVRLRGAERHERVAAGDGVLLSWLDCRLPGGLLNSWLLELRRPTEPTTHPGEEFVFCLRGRASLNVGGMRYELDAGDAASFWSAEPHFYGPADPLDDDDPSVLLLSVWVHEKDLSARRAGGGKRGSTAGPRRGAKRRKP